MGSLKDLTGGLKETLAGGVKMEGPTVTESGPNLNPHCLEGAMRCEVNSSGEFSHTDVGEEQKSDVPQSLGANDSLGRHSDDGGKAPQCGKWSGDNTDTVPGHFITEESAEKLDSSLPIVPVNNRTSSELLDESLNKAGGGQAQGEEPGHGTHEEAMKSVKSSNREPTILVTNHDSSHLTETECPRETASTFHATEPETDTPCMEGHDLGHEQDVELHQEAAQSSDTQTPHDLNMKETPGTVAHKEPAETNIEVKKASEQKHMEQLQGNEAESCHVFSFKGQSRGASLEDPSKETAGLLSPVLSPAPPISGHQHIQTQVSLEAPMCHSAATSPMTPPEGCGTFFFPYSFRKAGLDSTDTSLLVNKDGQMSDLLSFRSIATSPIGPLTPTVPESPCPEIKITGVKGVTELEKVNWVMSSNSQKGAVQDVHRDERGVTRELSKDAKTAPQSATIEEKGKGEKSLNESSRKSSNVAGPGHASGEENVNGTQDTQVSQSVNTAELSQKHRGFDKGQSEQTKTRQVTVEVLACSDGAPHLKSQSRGVSLEEPSKESVSLLSPVLSPAPPISGHQHIQTQVSLEAPMCHSAATSPMTPPESCGTFFFPYSFKKAGLDSTETGLASFRSIATSPMTPLTPKVPESPCPEIKVTEDKGVTEIPEDKKPTVLTEVPEDKNPTVLTEVPEVKKPTVLTEVPEVKKPTEPTEGPEVKKPTMLTEVPEVKKSTMLTEVLEVKKPKEPTKVPEVKKPTMLTEVPEIPEVKRDAMITDAEGVTALTAEDGQQEAVQGVRWDEKGMTWEVYGAAVEVEVLGTAIQKHLEKQSEDHGKEAPSVSPPVSPPPDPAPAPAPAPAPTAAVVSDPPPSPPPLPPSPPPPSPPPPTASAPSRSGSVKGQDAAGEEREGKKKKRHRRNPFRAVLRSMRRPRCCSRAHTIE
ncbi:uncharacterized protein KIAA1522 homolog [Megalops cyprinoides]|uniref:uncharacterized protein KIAA1522 homolog n=1 Tax=Megalops cyprinoides TaxID=118141 RepID=UPI0018640E7F|nr:uncharacterized protein KIAA1522 homolog [Megalops cyprinoides]